eukprot:15479563-Alexandrium_andersonii.AAC.1
MLLLPGFGRPGMGVVDRLIPPDGIPNTVDSSLLAFLNGLSIGSWNARAFLHCKPATRERKLRELRKLLRKFRIVSLRE